jgi:hypothetical protein
VKDLQRSLKLKSYRMKIQVILEWHDEINFERKELRLVSTFASGWGQGSSARCWRCSWFWRMILLLSLIRYLDFKRKERKRGLSYSIYNTTVKSMPTSIIPFRIQIIYKTKWQPKKALKLHNLERQRVTSLVSMQDTHHALRSSRLYAKLKILLKQFSGSNFYCISEERIEYSNSIITDTTCKFH